MSTHCSQDRAAHSTTSKQARQEWPLPCFTSFSTCSLPQSLTPKHAHARRSSCSSSTQSLSSSTIMKTAQRRQWRCSPSARTTSLPLQCSFTHLQQHTGLL